MRQENNIVIADEGKVLKTPNGIFNEVPLGTFIGWKDGEKYTVTNILEDIIEVTPIRILDKVYYITSNSYGEIVTELIRQKYTLDQELALYANSYIKDNSKDMEDYQYWRELCKEAAKKIYE